MVSADWLDLDSFDFDLVSTNNWLSYVTSTEGKELGELALIFCSDEELLKMNIRHLEHDYYTDIITFDYSETNTVIGDLFISVDRVKDNSVNLNIELEEELFRVIVHGVLHLCGYGDKGDEEVILMRQKEDFYLNKLKGFT